MIPKKSNKIGDSSIIRIFTDEERPRELGRIPKDITDILSPLFDLNIAQFECVVMVETMRRLSVGDSFYVSIDCFLKSTVFATHTETPRNDEDDAQSLRKVGTRVGFKFSSETAEEATLRLKQFSLSRLFDRLAIRLLELKNDDVTETVETVEATQEETKEEIIEENNGQNDENSETELDLDQLKQFYLSNQQSDFLQNLPENTEPPKENFKLQLREYQKLGLSWMLVREKELETLETLSYSPSQSFSTQAKEAIRETEQGVMNPLWRTYSWPADTSLRKQEGRDGETNVNDVFYANLRSGELSMEKPMLKTLVRGGILADEMGLGKTISTLSLINSVPFDLQYEYNKTDNYADKTTLVVVPMSLLTQWKKEFDSCNNNPNHQCIIYYGELVESNLKPILCNKNKDIPIMLITTYGTIQNEYQRLNKIRDSMGHMPRIGIYSVKFFRVVLDEGHTIRNRATKTAKAIHELRLSRKWILTGTPVINRLDDIYSLVKFLQLEPWCNFSYWKTFITLPFEQKKFSQTLDVVKSVLEPIFLRRTKNMKLKNGGALVELPPKEVVIEEIKFSGKEENLYNFFKSRANQSFKDSLKTGDLLKKYTQILTHILRLRQICCHPDLVGTVSELEETEASEKTDLENFVKTISYEDAEKFPSDTIMRQTMYGLYPKVNLKDSECFICTQSPIEMGEMIVTECGHSYCFNCILEHIEFQKNQGKDPLCPGCRTPVSKYRLFKLRNKETTGKRIRFHTLTRKPETDFDDPGDSYPFHLYLYDPDKSSAKIAALLHHLNSLKQQSPGEQVVVFSQFSSFLDLIENELSLYPDFIVYKFDGRLNMNEREKLLFNFNNHALDPDNNKIVILLLSLKAGGVGLNLTSASRAFMMDPWWSPSVEDQAIDRIHRIGQLKTVKVIRFVVANTIENKMLKIQERKRKMGEVVEVEEEERRKRRIEEIQLLFEE